MKTPVVLVAATLTIAILLAASLLIATETRGDDAGGALQSRAVEGASVAPVDKSGCHHHVTKHG